MQYVVFSKLSAPKKHTPFCMGFFFIFFKEASFSLNHRMLKFKRDLTKVIWSISPAQAGWFFSCITKNRETNASNTELECTVISNAVILQQ